MRRRRESRTGGATNLPEDQERTREEDRRRSTPDVMRARDATGAENNGRNTRSPSATHAPDEGDTTSGSRSIATPNRAGARAASGAKSANRNTGIPNRALNRTARDVKGEDHSKDSVPPGRREQGPASARTATAVADAVNGLRAEQRAPSLQQQQNNRRSRQLRRRHGILPSSSSPRKKGRFASTIWTSPPS